MTIPLAQIARSNSPQRNNQLFIRIRDTLHEGGHDFAFRVEITPSQPSLAIKIPEVSRNDTQSRQFIPVPRSNRFATLISAKRSNFGSELNFSITDLPAGVTMIATECPKTWTPCRLYSKRRPMLPLPASCWTSQPPARTVAIQ